MGAGVPGEEGQHAAGPLGPGGHVVLLQGGVGAPVHDRVEIQVENCFLAGGEPGGDHRGVQGGQERALVVVGQPAGVIGERRLLGQDRQPGQERGSRVHQQVIDVGHAPGGGELERQQRQQPAGGGDLPGAGVAGRGGHRGQVEGDQVGDGQQQPGHGGVGAAWQGGEVDDRGGGQPGVAAGGGRADAGEGLGAAQQPAESFLAQDVADGGAAQGGPLQRQPGADLVDRQALAAQLDDAAAGGVFPRRALAPGDARRREQGELACPQVADQGGQRRAGIAGRARRLPQGRAVMQVGAQRLVAPLVHLAAAGEQLPPRTRGRYGGHTADLPRGPGRPQWRAGGGAAVARTG